MDLLMIFYCLVLEVMVVLGNFRILDVLLVVPRTFCPSEVAKSSNWDGEAGSQFLM
jgi:hypothetical protein